MRTAAKPEGSSNMGTSNMGSSGTAIAPRALEQAAGWLVRLHDADAGAADHAACARWRAADPEHARAWERAERLMGKLGGLPPDLARKALDRPGAGRRAAVLRVAAVLAATPLSWGAWRLAEERQWTSDHATAPGERRTLALADGSRVTLNTDSAIDVRYGATERLLVLRRGEIHVDSGKDARRRPLRVATAQGRMTALGTRFTVRRHEDRTDVAVQEGAVRIEPETGAPLRLDAGQQSRFTAQAAAPATPVDPAGAAWLRGMLLADAMRLDALAVELARYRPGIVRVEPGVAALTVSGVFPIADTERTLAMLAQTHRLDVRRRWNGYWITLAAREPDRS